MTRLRLTLLALSACAACLTVAVWAGARWAEREIDFAEVVRDQR